MKEEQNYLKLGTLFMASLKLGTLRFGTVNVLYVIKVKSHTTQSSTQTACNYECGGV